MYFFFKIHWQKQTPHVRDIQMHFESYYGMDLQQSVKFDYIQSPPKFGALGRGHQLEFSENRRLNVILGIIFLFIPSYNNHNNHWETW